MYERMLSSDVCPSSEEMEAWCGASSDLFREFGGRLSEAFGTAQEIRFPYGKRYGWGIAHRAGKKLLCDVFPEAGAFTVMMRLSDEQFGAVYESLLPYTRDFIDRRYPCGSGGWIHYRVTCREQMEDAVTLLGAKTHRGKFDCPIAALPKAEK